jgi:hypothetical protein
MAHCTGPVDQDLAAQIMIYALVINEDLQPAGCLNLLCGCMHVLSDDHSWLIGALAKQHSDLTSAWMRFACTYRAYAELETLKDSLNDCRCSNGPPVVRNAPVFLHSVADDRKQPTIGNLIDDICVYLVVLLGDQPRLSSLYRSTKPRDHWPRRMEDLVPFDLIRCWHALGAWEYLRDTAPSNGPGTLMTVLIKDFGPYWLKGLLKSPALLLWVTHTVEMYEGILDEEADEYWRDADTIVSALEDLMAVASLLRHLTAVLFDDELMLWTGTLKHVEDSVVHVAHLCIQAVRMAEVAKSVLKGAELRRMMKTMDVIYKTYPPFFGRLAFRYQRVLQWLDIDASPKVLRDVLEKTLIASCNPFNQLIDGSFGSQWNDRCHGPGCLKTDQGLGRRMKVCSHCKVATYCSRKCQRVGWRYSDAPHRKVCELARRMVIWHTQNGGDEAELLLTAKRELSHDFAWNAANNFRMLHKSQFEQMRESSSLYTVVMHKVD